MKNKGAHNSGLEQIFKMTELRKFGPFRGKYITVSLAQPTSVGISKESSDALPFIKTGEELLNNDITEIPMLIEPIFQKYGLAALAGSSETGKSSMLRQLATSIVSGDDNFLGYRINSTHRSVIYVSTEDDEYAISALLKKQNERNIEGERLLNLKFIFDTEDLFSNLNRALSRQKADCVIIDAFSDLFVGDINMTSQVRPFLQKFLKLAKKYKCLFIVLHHTGKSKDNLKPSKHNLLGSQGFEGLARTVLELRRDPRNANYRHLCIVKGNYISDVAKERSIQLNFNENLVFENTGKMVDFDDLVVDEDQQKDEKEQAKKMAIQWKKEGKTVLEIFEMLKKIGLNNGKGYSTGTIGNWTKGIK